MPAASTFAFCGSPQPRQGFARCARRWRGLDSASALHTEGIYRSGGGSRRKENPMTERSLTPNITVTIGHHTRIYFAFVTTRTRRSRLTSDGHAPRGDVRGRGRLRGGADHARSVTRQGTRAPCARRRDGARLATSQVPRPAAPLLSADPVLVGLNTLQHWLWQRLQAPTTSQVAA